MTGAGGLRRSRSLRHQVANLEQRLLLRRQRVRNILAGMQRKMAASMSSPRMLLAAVGIGVALEHTSRQRGWSLASVLDASNACFRLLLSFSSSIKPVVSASAQTGCLDRTNFNHESGQNPTGV
jgi:hypothetical protein